MKNPVMVAAGKKAWATRRANLDGKNPIMVAAGKKAWVTRRARSYAKPVKEVIKSQIMKLIAQL